MAKNDNKAAQDTQVENGNGQGTPDLNNAPNETQEENTGGTTGTEGAFDNATPKETKLSAKTTPSEKDAMEAIVAAARDRKSVTMTGKVTDIQVYTPSEEQEKLNIVNAVIFVAIGSAKPAPFRVTAPMALIKDVQVPAVKTGDTVSMAVTLTGDAAYPYRARLTEHKAGLSMAQQQQMEMIAKLGIQLNISVG